MQVSRLILLGCLVTLCLSVHIPIKKQVVSKQISSSERHHKLNHQASVGQENVNSQENKLVATAKYLDDIELTIPVSYGSKTVNSVIDTTSFVSWVQSQDVTVTPAAACTGCPEQTSLFKCEGGCSVSKPPTSSPLNGQSQIKLQDATANAATTVYAFAGLNEVQGMVQAEEKSVSLAQLSVSNQQFGLGYKFAAPTNLNMLMKGQGQLGLAYGSVYKDYQELKKDQFTPLTATTFQPAQDDSLNMLSRLHAQNKGLVTSRQFSLKLEENLSILSFGKPQNYFAGGASKSFDNQGLKTWALKVSSFKLNAVAFAPTLSVGAPGHTRDIAVSFAAQLASSTRFIWVSENVATQLTQQFSTATGQTCTSDNVIACPCTSDLVDKFPDITLQFNGESDNFKIAKKDYAYHTKADNKCYTYIQKLPTQNSADTAANINTFVYNGAVENSATTAATVTSSVDILVLGQVFLQNYFTTFDMDTNQVTFAPPYAVSPDTIPINQTSRTVILVVAALLFLFALAALLALLKKVNYVPSDVHQQQPVRQSAVHAAPAQYQGQQQGYPPQQQTYGFNQSVRAPPAAINQSVHKPAQGPPVAPPPPVNIGGGNPSGFYGPPAAGFNPGSPNRAAPPQGQYRR